jgi:hypothetical protein
MISLRADGCSVAEIQMQFPAYAKGTIANLMTRRKAQVDDLRRARSVRFEDIPGVRKPTRVNDYWELRSAWMHLYRTHLNSCYATNPETGEQEFVEQLVDARKLKVYADGIIKAKTRIEAEMGQQIAPSAGPDVAWTRKVTGADGAGGIDYSELVRKHAEWQARSAVRDEWRWQEMLEQNLRRGMDWEQATEAVQQKKDRESGMSPDEFREAKWQRRDECQRTEHYENLPEFCAGEVAAALAELGPDAVDLAGIRDDLKAYAFPVADEVAAEVDAWFDSQACAVLVEAARNPVPELAPVTPSLEPESVRVPPAPPPGAGPGEWVWTD